MRYTLALLASAALSACGSAPSAAPTQAPTSATPEPVEDKPSLALDEVDARNLVESIGPAWNGMALGEWNDDTFSGGSTRLLTGRSASAAILTLPNGKVWNLQLRSGMAGRCGSPAILSAKLPTIVEKAAPSIFLPPEKLVALRRGFSGMEPESVVVGNVRIAAVGGCIPVLDIRTLWD